MILVCFFLIALSLVIYFGVHSNNYDQEWLKNLIAIIIGLVGMIIFALSLLGKFSLQKNIFGV